MLFSTDSKLLIFQDNIANISEIFWLNGTCWNLPSFHPIDFYIICRQDHHCTNKTQTTEHCIANVPGPDLGLFNSYLFIFAQKLSNYDAYLLYEFEQTGPSKQFGPRSDAAERESISVCTVCHKSCNYDTSIVITLEVQYVDQTWIFMH